MLRSAAALVLSAFLLKLSPQAPAPASFDDFLQDVRAEALTRGVSAATLDAALNGLTPLTVVVNRDRTQPEAALSIDEYVARRVTRRVVMVARDRALRHRSWLRRAEAAYGVPGQIVVAVWGLESNFGRFTGTYPTVQALASLAFDGRRPLFRRELLDALSILEAGSAGTHRLLGSWAGAMGQPQFLPSSYLRHAVDFDGDGQMNIWTSVPDVLGSVANYLEARGWHAGERWGREVALSATARSAVDRAVAMRAQGCRAELEMTAPQSLATWDALGVRLPGGHRLPSAPLAASLVRGDARAFLVYRNYAALLEYNCSNAYALSVALLADRVGSLSSTP